MNVADELRAAGLPEAVVSEGVAAIAACASCEADERRVPEHVRELIRLHRLDVKLSAEWPGFPS